MALVSVNTVSLNEIFRDLEQIRIRGPVIHNLSNLVVMPIIANLLLALGASPIMAHATEELAEIVAHSESLVLNIGTLDAQWLGAMLAAQDFAVHLSIPIVLDPVGAGVSPYRTTMAKKILSRGVQILRGNASEIMALSGTPYAKGKGVDTLHSTQDALPNAIALAQKYHCVVVLSGATDWVVSETRHISLDYGTPLLTKVVGMGCTLTAIIASFLAVNPDSFSAAAHAVAVFGLTAELAAQTTSGPGHFYTQLLDCLYSLKLSDLQPLMQGHRGTPLVSSDTSVC